MATKERLYRLVEELSEEEVPAAEKALEGLRHPALRALAHAPADDEPVTEADRRAMEEAEEDVRAGRLIPHEEVKRRLGIV